MTREHFPSCAAGDSFSAGDANTRVGRRRSTQSSAESVSSTRRGQMVILNRSPMGSDGCEEVAVSDAHRRTNGTCESATLNETRTSYCTLHLAIPMGCALALRGVC